MVFTTLDNLNKLYGDNIMKSLPVDACYMLFKKIEKPSNFEMCKAINVYDNKYRINVYTKNHDPIYDIDKVRITESYFCRITNNELTIIA